MQAVFEKRIPAMMPLHDQPSQSQLVRLTFQTYGPWMLCLSAAFIAEVTHAPDIFSSTFMKGTLEHRGLDAAGRGM